MLNLAQTQVRPAPTRRKLSKAMQRNAMMVKSLQVNMRVTIVSHTFGMPVNIVNDFSSQTITITAIDEVEGTLTGFDGLTPHTIVTKTFKECGIPNESDGWSTEVCTIPWEDASKLHRDFVNATRVSPFNRQLVGTDLLSTTPSWVS